MAVNHYLQGGIPGAYTPAQNTLYDIIEEAIRANGVNIYYLPRTLTSVDYVLTEDRLSQFNNAFMMEMYLENTQGYDGDGSFLSKFGIEINATCAFTVSRRRWERVVGSTGTATIASRPSEGDIIYFPLTQSMFEIKKVEHSNTFYQLGKLYTYRLDCELFQYSSERFNTGITEIDAMQAQYSTALDNATIDTEDSEVMADENGCPIVLEDIIDPTQAQNSVFDTAAKTVDEFSDKNPFGDFA